MKNKRIRFHPKRKDFSWYYKQMQTVVPNAHPCPLCGSTTDTVITVDWFDGLSHVVCVKCQAGSNICGSRKDALANWNRVALAAQQTNSGG